MFGYVTYNVKYYILSQIFYKKLGDCLSIEIISKTGIMLQNFRYSLKYNDLLKDRLFLLTKILSAICQRLHFDILISLSEELSEGLLKRSQANYL